MRIAYILFNGLKVHDFVGIYDEVSRLKALKYIPDLEWDVSSYTNRLNDNFGLEPIPDTVKTDLGSYKVIIVPGGFGTRKLQFGTEFMDGFKTSATGKTKTSVCTVSLLLGSAGYLPDKRAIINLNHVLKPYCKIGG